MAKTTLNVEPGTIRIDLNGLGGAAIAVKAGADLTLYTTKGHTLNFLSESPSNGSQFEQTENQIKKIQIRHNAAAGIYPFLINFKSIAMESLNYLVVLPVGTAEPDPDDQPTRYLVCPKHELCGESGGNGN